MSSVSAVPSESGAEKQVAGATRGRGIRAVVHRAAGAAAIGFLAVVALACVFAPLIAPYNPTSNNLNDLLQGPSAHHLLGTDQLGRDVLSRLLYGGQQSLLGVVEAVAVAAVLGVSAGTISGYLGGWVDTLVSRSVDIALGLPSIIIILVTLSIFGQNQVAAMIVLGILLAPGLTRIARAAAISAREELYVSAARASGLTPRQVILRHILPSIAGPVTVNISLLASTALLVQTGLSFLGLGVTIPNPSWGGMVADGATALNEQAWLIVPSGGIIALTCLAFITLGEALRDTARAGRTTTDSSLARRRAKGAARRRPAAPADAARPSSDALLDVRDLTVELPLRQGWTTVVDRASFTVRPGETVGLVGESGCGKTITRPKLIVCDEAVSALDLSTQAQVLNLLEDLQADLGMAMLFVSHDLAVVKYMAHRLIVLHRGSVMERGNAADIYHSPQHPYTKRLVEASPVPDPTAQRAAREAHRAQQAQKNPALSKESPCPSTRS